MNVVSPGGIIDKQDSSFIENYSKKAGLGKFFEFPVSNSKI